jgi:glycerophosphoryl diester phosphodiesterase
LVGGDMNDKIIIAHRSEFNIGKLIDSGVDMIEFDLRKTKDGVYVAFHSDSVNGRKVRDLNYSELSSFTNVEIPKVESFLGEYGKEIGFDVHLKEKGYEQDVLKFLLDYVAEKNLLITSEHLESLKKIRKINPKIKLG